MSVHLRPFVVSLRRHNAMCGMALRYWLSTLIRRKPFGLSVPRPENTRHNMFSMNQWLKTPDVDGRYQPIVRDFQAAIPEVLDALPRNYSQQPVSWMTRIFHQFDDVSLMAAQGIRLHRPHATHNHRFTCCRPSVFSPAAQRRATSELEELPSPSRPTCG